MKPIVSPWLIYIISMMDSLKFLTCIGAIFIGIIAFILYITPCNEKEKDVQQVLNKWARNCVFICIILLLLTVLLPSTMTAAQMSAASIVTPNNIDNVFQIIENAATMLLGEL